MPVRWVLALGLGLAGCRSTVDAVMGTEPRGELAPLAWLSGSWVLVDGERAMEEHWTRPAGGTMLGLNRTVSMGRTTAWEFLRIETTPQGIVYFASPGGRYPPTPFALVEQEHRRAVFENPDHDFPQRVIYAREGSRLEARIEGEVDGEARSIDWTYRRTAMDAMPP